MRRPRSFALVGLAFGLAVGSATPAATQSPSPSPAVSAAEDGQAGPPAMTWTRVDDPEALGGGVLLDIATTPAGATVAVGGGFTRR